MRIVAAMIIGAGEADRHLERALTSACEWADELLAFGDGADPATARLIRRFATSFELYPSSLFTQGEHIVRNRLFGLADWQLDESDMVVVLDADETIHQPADETRRILRELADAPEQAWDVRFLHLWTPDGTEHRVDGMWQPSTGTRIYRHQRGLRVEPLGAWVCPPVPRHLRTDPNPRLTVLHWGYARAADRPVKHDRYVRLAGHHPRHVASILQPPTLERVPA